MDDDSPYEIRVVREGGRLESDESRLTEAVARALRLRGVTGAVIELVLVDDRHIAELNRRYLGHSGPTDVISFNLSEPGQSALEGTVILSTETATREAHRRGHHPIHEAMLYAVHGVLHVTGLKDEDDQQAAHMHELEDRILTDMGIGPVFEARRS